MNKKLLKGKIMNIKRIIVLVLISASSGLLCAQRKTVNMSDRYGILTVTPSSLAVENERCALPD